MRRHRLLWVCASIPAGLTLGLWGLAVYLDTHSAMGLLLQCGGVALVAVGETLRRS